MMSDSLRYASRQHFGKFIVIKGIIACIVFIVTTFIIVHTISNIRTSVVNVYGDINIFASQFVCLSVINMAVADLIYFFCSKEKETIGVFCFVFVNICFGECFFVS